MHYVAGRRSPRSRATAGARREHCSVVRRSVVRWAHARICLPPFGLGVDVRDAAAAAAPGARDGLGRAAEVGDHLAAAATGHTLPRPVGRPPPDPRCRFPRSPRGDETSVPRMRRPARGSTSGWRRGADHRRGGGAAADPHRPRLARPVLRRGRAQHGASPGTTSSSARSSPAAASRSTSRRSTCGCRSSA